MDRAEIQELFEDWLSASITLYFEMPSNWSSLSALLLGAKARAERLGLTWRHEREKELAEQLVIDGITEATDGEVIDAFKART